MTVDRAKKSRSQNGQSWCVTFEHPFRKEAGGKKGQPIRMGLNLNSEEEAEKLRKQLNDLVTDEKFWTPKAKARANTLFDERIVAAVYDEQEEPVLVGIRNRVLPFQSEEGYANVQIIGERGAGKTTLLRQLLGLKDETELFPPAGMTHNVSYEIEWLLADQELYEVVVTFLPFKEVKARVEEAVVEAAAVYAMENSEQEMMKALMDRDFSLRSLMGPLPSAVSSLYGFAPPACDKTHLQRWEPYLKAMKDAAIRLRNDVLTQHVPDDEQKQRFLALWRQDPVCNGITDALLEEIERLFSILENGQITYHTDDWPVCWRLKTRDGDYFLQLLYLLFGDDPGVDGNQLTALVEGMRIKGPFRPLANEGAVPKLMLTERTIADGRLSAHQTERITSADAVMIVERAGSTAGCSLFKEMVINGQAHKMHIVFTNVEAVTGNRLPTHQDKCEHLLHTLHNRVQQVGSAWGERAGRIVMSALKQNGLYMAESSNGNRTVQTLQKLVHALEKSTIPKGSHHVYPIYGSTALSLAILDGARQFRNRIEYHDDIFSTFASCMGEALYRFFIQEPSGWSLPEAPNIEKDRTIERICFLIHQDLLAYAEEEITGKPLQQAVPTQTEELVRQPFLHDIYEMVKGCIERAGGVVIS
ncbi:hypothetical protein ACFOU2_14565 [Bacillus songklensis]|uniref:Uncharacterized protein n=1 Tax=Bacillus songklensis TaxID=1069116 RepID=A0ABV8B3A3_9BACI